MKNIWKLWVFELNAQHFVGINEMNERAITPDKIKISTDLMTESVIPFFFEKVACLASISLV